MTKEEIDLCKFSGGWYKDGEISNYFLENFSDYIPYIKSCEDVLTVLYLADRNKLNPKNLNKYIVLHNIEYSISLPAKSDVNTLYKQFVIDIKKLFNFSNERIKQLKKIRKDKEYFIISTTSYLFYNEDRKKVNILLKKYFGLIYIEDYTIYDITFHAFEKLNNINENRTNIKEIIYKVYNDFKNI